MVVGKLKKQISNLKKNQQPSWPLNLLSEP
jgi:hypothetical protein